MAGKAADLGFQSEWNKAATWASSQGIPFQNYAPVYQLDLQRLQNYGIPMSVGERSRAIIAANNPSQVTSAPTDNPRPTNVLGNTRRDLGMIFTGLDPLRLVPNLFHTTMNTIQAITDPKKMEGKTAGGTIANWLQNTLLSFVPGAYDVGTVLKADPTLSGSAGFKALAENPLISALDVLPAGPLNAVTKGLARTGVGASLADHLGMTPGQFAAAPLHELLRSLPTHVMGVDPAGGAIGQLTVGQWVTSKLQNSWIGTSAPVQQLAKAMAINDQHYTAISQTLLDEPVEAVQSLTSEQQQQFQGIITANQKDGKNLQQLLEDPQVSPAVRHAVTEFTKGPLRFAREEALASGDVVPVRRPDGTTGIYTSTQDKAVTGALDTLKQTHRDVMGQMEAIDPLLQRGNQLDVVRPKLADSLQGALEQARQVTETDPSLEENAVEQTQGGRKIYGRKRDLARRLFGTDGMVDMLVKAARDGDNDRMREISKSLTGRLEKWGEYSIEAGAHPAFGEVLRRTRMLGEVAKRQDSLADDINRRIVGNVRDVSRETAQMRADRSVQRDQLQAQQAVDRTNHVAARRQELDTIDTGLRLKTDHFERLYQQMKEAALVKGDHAAARATKAQADAIYQQVRREMSSLLLDRNQATSTAKREAESQAAAAKGRWASTRKQLATMHKIQKQQLADEHYAQRQIDGELTRTAREHLRSLREFHKAVYEHPTDNYRDMRAVLYQKHLLDGLHNAELIDRTEQRLRTSGMAESHVQTVRADPARLGEAVSVLVRDVYDDPANWDPRLVEHVQTAKAAAERTAKDEINRLAAEGYHPEWLPAVGPFERTSSTVRTSVGRGKPHVDVGFRRSNDLVNTRFDIVAGATKAVTQALRRDASIDFLEHYLGDKVLTGDQVREQLDALGVPAEFDPNAETLTHAYSQRMAELGLARFDPHSIFGFSSPRFEGKALYLPKGLVTGLEKYQELQRKSDMGIYDKATRVFRFSVLGLSPRYTAHIVFGGSFLLGLRSTPYLPVMLAKVARAMKDGTIPQEIFTRPVEEGALRLPRALQEHAQASGKQMAHLAIQEHLEKIQGVLLHKASPLHYLKAAADLNFKFTHWVVNMQRAAAYMDYAERAERRGHFVDDVTGQKIPMTKERARIEGQNHVTAVFGDMRSMSPLERQLAGRVFPFYGWTRHILRYVTSYPADHPWRAMVLSLMGYENSQAVPKGLPERIQFLFGLGSPDSLGNVTTVDTRFMDPIRDTANYATLAGWLQGLNPAMLAPLAMVDPQIVFGSNQLYPNLSYNQFYGISTAGTQGSAITGLQQFVPQLGAVDALTSALTTAGHYRQLAKTNPNQFWKTIFQDLNLPGVPEQKNVKQIAAQDEIARYGVAKQAATNAFDTGDFSLLNGYANVPNPLNPDYDISPAQLEAIYNAALQQFPGQAPAAVVTPPPTPAGL